MSVHTSLPGIRLASVPVPISPGVRDALVCRWLAPRELRLLSPLAVEKRSCEFVAGRLAAKTAVARLRGMPIARDVVHTLVADGAMSGQPIAADTSGRRMTGIHLTITHSDGMAIAAAAMEPIGIDLAPVEMRTRAFEDDVFVEGELDGWRRVLGASAPARVQAVAFAAKEAALKWLGVGLRLSLHDIRVTPISWTGSSRCADLGVPMLWLTVRLQAGRPAAAHVRCDSVELFAAVADVGRQTMVTLCGHTSAPQRNASKQTA